MFPRRAVILIIFIIVFAVFFNLPKFNKDIIVKTSKVNFGVLEIPEMKANLNDLLERFPVKLGLDLQGGTQLVLEAKMDKIDPQNRDDALESAREIIERRVNLFGVSESVVQTSRLGESRRILVDLPGVKDSSAAAQLIGKTAQLEFREIPATLSGEATKSALIAIYSAIPTGLTGADLSKATVAFGSGGTTTDTGAQVSIQFTGEGGRKFSEITRRNIGKQLPIFLDEELVSAPVVSQEIIGNAVISGDFTTEEAKNLAIQLNAGALPVPIEILEQRSVGASLGQESVNKSLVAGIIGLISVMIYMALYYGVWGLIADLALLIYAVLVLTIFRTGFFILSPITLTLAGIAGFILSIGMAVDANILIFERMREELRWGRSKGEALELGFSRAWSSIRDSNFSSLITALILYFMGSGLVKGFAITLAIGVLVSMFTAIIVTRTILRILFYRDTRKILKR